LRACSNPAEELNYHGAIKNTNNTLRGANYGYPSCFSAWVPSEVGLTAAGQQFIPDSVPKPSTGNCNGVIAPRLAFPSHTAPLDVKFNADGSAAYITFHGSW
jgi:glucose/arabinose dehydrogenase